MKTIFYLSILFGTAIMLSSCQKTTVQPPFDSVFTEPYTTGMIKFQYKVVTNVNNLALREDTTVLFTSAESDNADPGYFGYSDSATSFFSVLRLNKPNDFVHFADITIQFTDFNKLTLPYTFKPGTGEMGQFEYSLGGLKTLYDSLGGYPTYEHLTYSANTNDDSFKLTILSRANNRVQGIFGGIATNQDGVSINISQGLFDAVIVNK